MVMLHVIILLDNPLTVSLTLRMDRGVAAECFEYIIKLPTSSGPRLRQRVW